MRNKSLHSSLSTKSQLFFICNGNYGDLAVVKKINLVTKPQNKSLFFFPKNMVPCSVSPVSPGSLRPLVIPWSCSPQLPFRFELHVHVQRLSSSAVVKKTSTQVNCWMWWICDQMCFQHCNQTHRLSQAKRARIESIHSLPPLLSIIFFLHFRRFFCFKMSHRHVEPHPVLSFSS